MASPKPTAMELDFAKIRRGKPLNGYARQIESQVKAACKKSGVKVKFSGDSAYATSNSVNIPKVKESITHEEADVYKGYCTHEVQHVKHTDFNSFNDLVNVLGTSTSKDVDESFVHSVYNCLEDCRVETTGKLERSGAITYLDAMNYSLLDKVTEGKPRSITNKPVDAMMDALHHAAYAAPHPHLEDHPAIKGMGGNPHFDRFKNLLKPITDKIINDPFNSTLMPKMVKEAVRRLAAEYKKAKEEEKNKGGKGNDQPQKGDQSNGQGAPNPQQVKDGLQSIKEDLTNRYQKSGKEYKTDFSKAKEDTMKDLSQKTKKSKSSTARGLDPTESNVGFTTCLYMDVDKEKSLAKKASSKLKHSLGKAFLAHRWKRTKRYQEFGKLDIKSARRFLLQGQTNIFKHTKKTKQLNTAIHVTLDVSGSMCGSNMDQARLMMLATERACSGLNVDVSASIYNGDYKIIKTPHSKIHDDDIRRMHAQGGTALIPAVIKSAKVLKAFDNDRKILIVITDGDVSDVNDTMKVAQANGVETYMVVIGLSAEYAAARGKFPLSNTLSFNGEFSKDFLKSIENLIIKGNIK